MQRVAALPEGGVALGKAAAVRQRFVDVDVAGIDKECSVMGVTAGGGVFANIEVASHRRGGTGHPTKEFVDRLLQPLASNGRLL